MNDDETLNCGESTSYLSGIGWKTFQKKNPLNVWVSSLFEFKMKF